MSIRNVVSLGISSQPGSVDTIVVWVGKVTRVEPVLVSRVVGLVHTSRTRNVTNVL